MQFYAAPAATAPDITQQTRAPDPSYIQRFDAGFFPTHKEFYTGTAVDAAISAALVGLVAGKKNAKFAAAAVVALSFARIDSPLRMLGKRMWNGRW